MEMDERVVLWLMLPAIVPDEESLGKTVVCLKAKANRITGAIQKVAKSGDFWAVLRAETPGVSAMLKRTLENLGYTIRAYDLPEFKRAAGSLADVLLSHINEPLRVLDSAKEVHSPGSSGGAVPSERPRTREEKELLSAFDDAATQATGSARARSRDEARRAADERAQAAAQAAAKETADRAKESADRERQLFREALAKAEQDAERARREAKEAAEKAAERERREAERERLLTEKAERAAEKAAERERQAERAAKEAADKLLIAVERAATAEAKAKARRCNIM